MIHKIDGFAGVCLCSGQVIVLDEPAQKYLLLSGNAACGVKDALSSRETSGQGVHRLPQNIVALPARLADRHLVTPTFSVPTRSLIEASERQAVSTALFCETTAHVVRALVAHATVSFSGNLDRLRRRKPDAQTGNATGEGMPFALRDAAMHFHSARRLLPIKPVCLQDSIALLDFLWQRGFCPSLVIGVRLHPFAAHCWVQTSDLLLNETVDTAAAFQPIQVI